MAITLGFVHSANSMGTSPTVADRTVSRSVSKTMRLLSVIGIPNFMLGGKLFYINAEGTFKLASDVPVDFGEEQAADSGLAAQAVWDTRDNTMTPNRGQLLELVAWRFDEALAGDNPLARDVRVALTMPVGWQPALRNPIGIGRWNIFTTTGSRAMSICLV